MRLFILSLGWIALLSPAYANDVVGNGGDVVNCPNSVTMLDLYEGESIRKIIPDVSLTGVDEKVTVENALNRMRAFDPVRADVYQQLANEFWQEVSFVPNASLVDIPDSQHVAVPHGCKIEQVAIQIKPKFPEDPRYIVDKSLWDRMPTLDRASLILHEIIYREALELKQKNSKRARYFNSILSSVGLPTFSGASYLAAARNVDFPLALLVKGITVEGKSIVLAKDYCPSEDGLSPFPWESYKFEESLQKLFYPAFAETFEFWWPGTENSKEAIAINGWKWRSEWQGKERAVYKFFRSKLSYYKEGYETSAYTLCLK